MDFSLKDFFEIMLSGGITFYFTRKHYIKVLNSNKQTQESGNNCHNYQAGKDIVIGDKDNG